MIRVCQHCDEILRLPHDALKTLQITKESKPIPVVVLHDRLLAEINDIVQSLPGYNSLAFSLMRGEGIELYSHALEEKSRLSKQFQLIDVLSKKILSLGTPPRMQQEELAALKAAGKRPPGPGPNEQRITKAIRARVVEFMQMNMLQMASVPPGTFFPNPSLVSLPYAICCHLNIWNAKV